MPYVRSPELNASYNWAFVPRPAPPLVPPHPPLAATVLLCSGVQLFLRSCYFLCPLYGELPFWVWDPWDPQVSFYWEERVLGRMWWQSGWAASLPRGRWHDGGEDATRAESFIPSPGVDRAGCFLWPVRSEWWLGGKGHKSAQNTSQYRASIFQVCTDQLQSVAAWGGCRAGPARGRSGQVLPRCAQLPPSWEEGLWEPFGW